MKTTIYVYSSEHIGEPRMIHAIEADSVHGASGGIVIYTIGNAANTIIAGHAAFFSAASVNPHDPVTLSGCAWTDFEQAKSVVERSLGSRCSRLSKEMQDIRESALIIENQECCVYCGRVGVVEDFCYMDEDGERASCESCAGGDLYSAADEADLKNDMKRDER